MFYFIWGHWGLWRDMFYLGLPSTSNKLMTHTCWAVWAPASGWHHDIGCRCHSCATRSGRAVESSELLLELLNSDWISAAIDPVGPGLVVDSKASTTRRGSDLQQAGHVLTLDQVVVEGQGVRVDPKHVWDLIHICKKGVVGDPLTVLPFKIFQKVKVATNKNTRKSRYHFLAQFFMLCHTMWSILSSVLFLKTLMQKFLIVYWKIGVYEKVVSRTNSPNKTDHIMWSNTKLFRIFFLLLMVTCAFGKMGMLHNDTCQEVRASRVASLRLDHRAVVAGLWWGCSCCTSKRGRGQRAVAASSSRTEKGSFLFNTAFSLRILSNKCFAQNITTDIHRLNQIFLNCFTFHLSQCWSNRRISCPICEHLWYVLGNDNDFWLLWLPWIADTTAKVMEHSDFPIASCVVEGCFQGLRALRADRGAVGHLGGWGQLRDREGTVGA